MRFIFIYFTSIQFNKKFKNNISPKFNSKDYSKLFISDQFKIQFKTLKLAGFNSTKYSFNLKMWVSIRAISGPNILKIEKSIKYQKVDY